MSMEMTGKIEASGGAFYVTDAKGNAQKVDLGTLMMMLNLDRVNNIDKQIEVQIQEIQQRNTLLNDLTAFMAECRAQKASSTGGDFGMGSKLAPSGRSYSDLWNQVVGGAWSNNTKDKDTKANSWEANINAIKGKIDMLNNDSQMDNIKLQNLLEKRSNAFEMATKVMDTNKQSVQSIIRNL